MKIKWMKGKHFNLQYQSKVEWESVCNYLIKYAFFAYISYLSDRINVIKAKPKMSELTSSWNKTCFHSGCLSLKATEAACVVSLHKYVLSCGFCQSPDQHCPNIEVISFMKHLPLAFSLCEKQLNTYLWPTTIVKLIRYTWLNWEMQGNTFKWTLNTTSRVCIFFMLHSAEQLRVSSS